MRRLPAWSALALGACSMAGRWDAGGAGPIGPRDTAPEEHSTPPGEAPALVITEIMKDPDAVGDDFGEWFELTSLADQIVNLEGLAVDGPGRDRIVISGPLLLAAGARLVLGNTADPALNGGVNLDYVYSVEDLKLSNEGGTLSLEWDDDVIDRVNWDELPDQTGRSISLAPEILDVDDNDLVGSWCSATSFFGAGDRGTPGTVNDSCDPDVLDSDGDGVVDALDCDPADETVYAGAPEIEDGLDNDCDGWTDERPPGEGELVITEIMDDPTGEEEGEGEAKGEAEGDEVQQGEWFEIKNVSVLPLVLSGMKVSDRDGESFVVTEATILGPGGLLLFGASDDAEVVPNLLFDTVEFHLDNEDDEIRLMVDGILVDEVAYDDDFPHQQGRSRSLDPSAIDTTLNDEAGHWCAGKAAYGTEGNKGTPGAENEGCP